MYVTWMVAHNMRKRGCTFHGHILRPVVCFIYQLELFNIYLSSVMINFIEVVVQFSKVINEQIVSTSVTMKRAVIMVNQIIEEFPLCYPILG
jgi:hypothetical protein